MVPRAPRLAERRHRKVVVVLAVTIALALSGLGIESASASTRSRLALSLNSDRSSAARLDGSRVSGKIYVFVRNSKTLDKVAFYIDSPQWRKRSPVRTDKKAPFDLAGTKADGTARPYNTAKLADGTHTIRIVMTWTDGTTSTRRGRFKVHNGSGGPTLPQPPPRRPQQRRPQQRRPQQRRPRRHPPQQHRPRRAHDPFASAANDDHCATDHCATDHCAPTTAPPTTAPPTTRHRPLRHRPLATDHIGSHGYTA